MFWWEDNPARWQKEIKSFKACGFSPEPTFVDVGTTNKVAFVKITVENPDDKGGVITLLIGFPDLYPKFAFQVQALDWNISRHLNPFDKGICLFSPDTVDWNEKYTAAEEIKARLPLIYRSATTKDITDARSLETPQPEPISFYYPYTPNFSVLSDLLCQDFDVDQGKFVFRGSRGTSKNNEFIGIISEFTCGEKVLKSDYLSDYLPEGFQFEPGNGYWLKLPDAPLEANPQKVFEMFLEDSRISNRIRKILSEKGKKKLIGFCFSEEGLYRKTTLGWIFILRERDGTSHFVRANRASKEEIFLRIPETKFLHDKTITLFGLGCLGAQSAIDFAKAGAREIRIVDFDICNPGNSVRWPLGFGVTGKEKVTALKTFIETHWPLTKIRAKNLKIGGATQDPTENQKKTIDLLLENTNLIYDATAQWGVNNFLSGLAKEKNIPYIWVETSPGVFGGLFGRYIPGITTGCWRCFCYQAFGEKNPKLVPNFDKSGEVQPLSCTEATFTGLGIDTSLIANHAVRLAISTLGEGRKENYPDVNWDIGLLNVRDKKGFLTDFKLETMKLEKHPSCNHG